MPAIRPRASAGLMWIIRPNAETKNIVDPMPLRARKNSNCQYVWANPHAAVENATTSKPLM